MVDFTKGDVHEVVAGDEMAVEGFAVFELDELDQVGV